MALPVGQSLHLPRRGDGTVWTPDRAGLVVPLDLWGARSVPTQFSSLSWPTAPAAGGSAIASSISELNSLAAGGGTITLQPGVYSGQLDLSNPDVHLILNGCQITGGFFNPSSGSRIRIDGGRIITAGQNVFNGSDLYFNNMRLEASGFAWADSLFVINSNAQRIALINCSLINDDPNSGRVIYQYAIGGTTTSDIIIAGTELLARNPSNPGQWAARFNGASRVVIVDSRLEVVSPSQSGRYHADDNATVSGYYSARNQIVGGTWNNEPFSSTGFAGGSITGIYFYDNDFYRNDANGQLAFQSLGTGSVSVVSVYDNTHYTLQNGGAGNMQIDVGPVSSYQASNNVRAPYQSPPAFTFGSDQ